jgi:hypothetical protein
MPEHPSTPPVTQDQLRFFINAQKRAVNKAVKRTHRNAVLGYVILLVGVFGMYWNGQSLSQRERNAIVESGKVVSVDGCNRDYETITALRAILTAANDDRRRAYRLGRLTPEEYADAKVYFDRQLKTLVLPDCRIAERVLTANPDAPRELPSPKYPEGE